MALTMKGFMKGLRYISQIFDEEEQIEQEIEIGLPTDVKHVAHIGADGPSAFNAPSWVKEFQQPQTGFESTILGSVGNDKEKPGIKLSSAESKGNAVPNSIPSSHRELPKSTTRDILMEKNGSELPKKKESKSKQTKKKNSKEFSEGAVKGTRELQETSLIANSPSQNLPDIPKKSRRKKSKEIVSVGGPSKLRPKPDMLNDSYNS